MVIRKIKDDMKNKESGKKETGTTDIGEKVNQTNLREGKLRPK